MTLTTVIIFCGVSSTNVSTFILKRKADLKKEIYGAEITGIDVWRRAV